MEIDKESNQPQSNNIINYGDLIIVYEGGDSIKHFTLEKGKILENKYGRFKHDSICGKVYGSRIYNTKNDKFITILSFVPCIWERCLNKMTQIIFNPDISIIMTLLNITQSSIIYESGSGSGCLSTNMAGMFSTGHLYTFEFNKERADKLKDVFKLLKLEKNITVTHRDVLENGFELKEEELKCSSHKLCDGIFIDLPSPWLVVGHAKKVLKKGGHFVTFSPCIEQINETMKAMKENGMIDIRMFECIYRTYSYAKTNKVKIPVFNKKRKCGEEMEFKEEEINVKKNKCDIRGHTGFVMYGINC